VLPAERAGARPLQLDVKAAAGLPAECGDFRETRHIRHRLAQLGKTHVRDKQVPLEDALQMVVMGDDDHAVRRHLGVEFPHLGAEFGSAAKGGERVFPFVAACAAMADAEWQPALPFRPAEFAEEGGKVAHQSLRHNLWPSSAKTKVEALSRFQRTLSPGFTSSRTGWIERSTEPSGSTTS
jgi:hypothetical protein